MRFQAPVAGRTEIGVGLAIGSPPAALEIMRRNEDPRRQDAAGNADVDFGIGVPVPAIRIMRVARMGNAEIDCSSRFKTLRIASDQLDTERFRAVPRPKDDAPARITIEAAGIVISNLGDGDRMSVAQRKTAETLVAENRGGCSDFRPCRCGNGAQGQPEKAAPCESNARTSR